MREKTLSPTAIALFRLHVEQDGIRVDDTNREAHRELAAAGIMYPVSTFGAGRRRISASRPKGGSSGMKFWVARRKARDNLLKGCGGVDRTRG